MLHRCLALSLGQRSHTEGGDVGMFHRGIVLWAGLGCAIVKENHSK
jgi:hypothetical protein